VSGLVEGAPSALVTGATGFLGSHLTERLLARGHRVTALVRQNGAPRLQRGSQLTGRLDLEVIEGGLGDAGAIERAVQGVDVVYHLAWQSNRPSVHAEADSSTEQILAANVEGTERLLRACEGAGVGRFVYASTVAVYGETSRFQPAALTEDDVAESDTARKSAMRRNYIEPKLAAERLVAELCADFGVEYVIVRPSIVYGPDAPFADQLVEAALGSEPAGMLGSSVLQLVHVDDVVDLMLIAAEHPDGAGRAFSVAGDDLVTKAQLDAMIRRAAETNGPVERMVRLEEWEPPRYDLTRAEALLGFRPRVGIERGVPEMVAAVLHRGGVENGHQENGRDGGGTELTELLDDYYSRMLSVDVLGDFYEHSDFWNFGYRPDGIGTQKEACEELLECLLECVPEVDGLVLDVACGKGATTRYLGQYFRPEDITGINISEAQLERCRSNAPRSTFLNMDACRLDFPDEHFDYVFCIEAATHFDTRERFFGEALRVLKPGGRLLFSDAILHPESHGQPAENYVTSSEEYGESCIRAGFVHAEVIDATEECWDAFVDHLRAHMAEQLWSGEVSLPVYRGVMTWLWQANTELYVLGWCEKGTR
jgi:MPBQ/MSBQ methyltransferase